MKIALLHNLYGKFSRGGAETAVALMAADYRQQGHDVFVITTLPRDAKPQATDDKIYQLSSDFYNLGERSSLYRLLWQIANIFSFRKYRQISQILRTEKPDLVVSHNLMGLGFLAPLAVRRLKIRHEHFLHDIQLLHPSGLMLWGEENKIGSWPARVYQTLTRALFASPGRVISPSRWLLDMHADRGFFQHSEKGVRPLSWPQAAGAVNPRKRPAKQFLFIGQIERQKGILLLIRAFQKISGADLQLTIAIRGGGRDLSAAQALAAPDTRIAFQGPLTYEETEKIKAASDCLIVPSLCYENSPTVIYGAHAAGLPVIAAAIGGTPELIGPGDHLFSPGDEEDLIRKIKLTM